MHVSVVLGTGREGRQSEKVSTLIFNELEKRISGNVEYVDVRDCLRTPWTKRYDETTGKGYPWYESAMRSSAFIFVIPEYNRSYPGEWKLLLDSLYKNAYGDKVAGLVGVSDGQFGGVRALESARLSLSNRGMYVLKDALHFPVVDRQFDTEGNVIEEEQQARVAKFLDMFVQAVSLAKKH
jgi:NAD(P)H-dependent FMN reductase